VLGNDADPNGDPVTVALVTAPPNGTVVLNADGSFTYDPDPAFVGTDTFTYQASDDNIDGVSDVATVTITVDATGEPPTTPTSTSTTTSGGGAVGGAGRGTLPATGSEAIGLVLVALLLVAGGSMAVAIASRRRPSTDDH
jgi:LPXTG-motif cell wall-anchored protein